jgi:hypothetical protein
MTLAPMKSDPLALASRHVVETRDLLQSLITSSESFDYQRAKAVLKKLEKKARDLEKLQARLHPSSVSAPTNVYPVDFKNSRPLRASN